MWGSLLGLSSALTLLTVPSVTAAPNDRNFDAKCASLGKKLKVDNGVVNLVESIAAGTNLSLSNQVPSCSPTSIVVPVDLCRISLNVTTSKRSAFRMEAWLPSDWTGRFLTTGNGGMGGCIGYGDMSYGTSLGFAAVGSNNGHDGDNGLSFYNNPESLADFVYRARHLSTVAGKQIIKSFYGKKHTKSYYLGCSTGGRQGFKAAQDYPEDFDGIVAGAPALAFNNLTSWSGSFYNLTGPPGSPTFLPPELWVTVHLDVLKQCDALDGYVDGIIEDPRLCDYDPSGLICPEGTTANCLTPAQAGTVKGALSPLRTDSGDLVYPRLQPGAEIIAAYVLFNGQTFSYTADWFRYAIYNDPSWDPTTIDSDDFEAAARKNPFNAQTWEGNLSAVQKRGAKIIHWHGGEDFIITSDNSPRYYEHVKSTMRLSNAQLDTFYRYFLVSGTGHCSGGNGAHAIGQQLGEVNSNSPKENVLMAMVDWVEKGRAPETLRGTKWVNDQKELGVDFQRDHCKYPKRNQYIKGDPKLPSSWKCVNL